MRPFTELKKNRLIEEKKLPQELISKTSTWVDETILCLPVFVSKCLEAEITEEQHKLFTSVLSKHFLSEFKFFYFRNHNIEGNNNPKARAQFNLHENNFWAFMQRM